MNFLVEYVNKEGNEIIGEYGYSSIGAAVGATFPKEVKELRKIMKNIFNHPVQIIRYPTSHPAFFC